MATGPQTGTATATAGAKQTPYHDFAYRVWKGTGIDPFVVVAWMTQEGGKPGNPLNIMDPAKHAPFNFGTPEAAAAETVKLLHNPRYSHILGAASSGDLKLTIDAISKSPWDACNYRGTKPDGSCVNAPVGSALLGVYRALFGTPGKVKPGTATAAMPGGVQENPVGPDLTGGVLGFLEGLPGLLRNEAVLGLAYLVPTTVAIALFVIGASRATGIGVPSPARRVKDGIPY